MKKWKWLRENFWLWFPVVGLLWYWLAPESWKNVAIWAFVIALAIYYLDLFADTVAERVVEKLRGTEHHRM